MLDYDGMERHEHDRKLKTESYKDVFYYLQYGDTRDQVAYVEFFMSEYEGSGKREFDFTLENISMQQFDACIAAIENWHYSGELVLGDFSTYACPGPWRKR